MTEAVARRLFRATGNRTKPKPELLDDGTFELTDAPSREKHDFNPTPPEPTRALLYAELPRMRELGGWIWEASAGDGAMVRELEAVGLHVYASDLIDRGCGAVIRDYYDFSTWPISDILTHKKVTVQNPPFKEASAGNGGGKWIRHTRDALKADYAAFLLPLAWPGAASQSELWDLDPPARVYVMRWRIDFTGEGAQPIFHAWYVYDGVTKLGDTKFLMLDKWMDARQGELL